MNAVRKYESRAITANGKIRKAELLAQACPIDERVAFEYANGVRFICCQASAR